MTFFLASQKKNKTEKQINTFLPVFYLQNLMCPVKYTGAKARVRTFQFRLQKHGSRCQMYPSQCISLRSCEVEANKEAIGILAAMDIETLLFRSVRLF
jgi:hypothetical protein